MTPDSETPVVDLLPFRRVAAPPPAIVRATAADALRLPVPLGAVLDRRSLAELIEEGRAEVWRAEDFSGYAAARDWRGRSEIAEISHARPEQLTSGYLQRLRRLLRLRRDHFEELNEAGLRLLDRSIFSA